MFWYAFASLFPACLIVSAALSGGVLPAMALIAMTVVVATADRLTRVGIPAREDGGTPIMTALGVAHFIALPVGVWAIASASWIGSWQGVMLWVALGLFLGQISNSNAHELIHARARWMRLLGRAIYVSVLFGHHVSAHLKVHHVHVATKRDPNSAPKGMSFWRFWPTAFFGSFRAGLAAEQRTRQARHDANPYLWYVGGGLLSVLAALALAGWKGAVVYIALCIYVQMQLLLADYVQHYGLQRTELADGRHEPAGPQHSWNAAPWYSSAMMLNAPRHSDHHQNPMRPFPALRLDRDTMPVLPYSLPVMASIALLPRLWRRVMDQRVDRWTADVAR